MTRRKQIVGAVIGKFLPFHSGHELLIRFAAAYSDVLYVLVDHVPAAPFGDDFIPGDVRVQMIRETFPDVHVRYIPDETPMDPSERPDFWDVWRRIMADNLPEPVDYLFAAEVYGFRLAEVMGCEFIPFDLRRSIVGARGTTLRSELDLVWDDLSLSTRRRMTMRICIFGPESCGKSTLSQVLARAFNTISAPEYARFYLEAYQEQATRFGTRWSIKPDDMPKIARGQSALEESVLSQANRVLFSDTDVLTTSIWNRWFFGETAWSDEILEIARSQLADHYILLTPDIPWIADDIRYYGDEADRQRFFEDCRQILEAHDCSYTIVSGQGEQRTSSAERIVLDFMAAQFNHAYFARRLRG